MRECEEGEQRIPFYVGDDHGGIWTLTRTADSLRLKHDHRLEDGSEAVVTRHGGDAAQAGAAMHQELQLDQHAVELRVREGSTVSTGNIWEMSIEPAQLRLRSRRRKCFPDRLRPVSPGGDATDAVGSFRTRTLKR